MIKLYRNSYKARRWLKLGVMPSFLPIASVVLYDIYLGYSFKNIVNRHLLDFILVIFAISVSVFSSAMVLYKKTKSQKTTEKIENYIIYAITIGLICTGAFTLLYDQIKPDDNLSTRKSIFCLALIIMNIILVYKGMCTEKELELRP